MSTVPGYVLSGMLLNLMTRLLHSPASSLGRVLRPMLRPARAASHCHCSALHLRRSAARMAARVPVVSSCARGGMLVNRATRLLHFPPPGLLVRQRHHLRHCLSLATPPSSPQPPSPSPPLAPPLSTLLAAYVSATAYSFASGSASDSVYVTVSASGCAYAYVTVSAHVAVSSYITVHAYASGFASVAVSGSGSASVFASVSASGSVSVFATASVSVYASSCITAYTSSCLRLRHRV